MYYSLRGGESHIAELDLLSGTLRPITPSSEWGKWQWPSYSPSGKHIAAIVGLARGALSLQEPISAAQASHCAIWVDGQEIATHSNIVSYDWVSEEVIAFSADDSLFVVATNGRMLSRNGFKIETPK